MAGLDQLIADQDKLEEGFQQQIQDGVGAQAKLAKAAAVSADLLAVQRRRDSLAQTAAARLASAAKRAQAVGAARAPVDALLDAPGGTPSRAALDAVLAPDAALAGAVRALAVATAQSFEADRTLTWANGAVTDATVARAEVEGRSDAAGKEVEATQKAVDDAKNAVKSAEDALAKATDAAARDHAVAALAKAQHDRLLAGNQLADAGERKLWIDGDLAAAIDAEAYAEACQKSAGDVKSAAASRVTDATAAAQTELDRAAPAAPAKTYWQALRDVAIADAKLAVVTRAQAAARRATARALEAVTLAEAALGAASDEISAAAGDAEAALADALRARAAKDAAKAYWSAARLDLLVGVIGDARHGSAVTVAEGALGRAGDAYADAVRRQLQADDDVAAQQKERTLAGDRLGAAAATVQAALAAKVTG